MRDEYFYFSYDQHGWGFLISCNFLNTNQLLTSREYYDARRQTQYKDPTNQTNVRFAKGTNWIEHQVEMKNGKIQTETTLSDFHASGAPSHQSTIAHDNDKKNHTHKIESDLGYTVVGESLAHTSTTSSIDGASKTTAWQLIDSNGDMNAQIGLESKNGHCKDTINIVDHAGHVLETLICPRTRDKGEDYEYFTEFYKRTINYYNTNGQPIATQSLTSRQESRIGFGFDLKVLLHHAVNQSGGIAFIARRQGKDIFLRSTGQHLFNNHNIFKFKSERDFKSQIDNVSITPQKYVVKTGETYQGISRTIYGTDEFAYEIASENGGDVNSSPSVGFELTLPRLEVWSSKAGDYQPYEKFISSMILALNPALKMPKQKTKANYLEVVVKSLAIAAACIVAPALAPALLPVGAGMLATALASAALAGLTDAAVQGAACAVGLEKHFSVNDVIESAAIVGAGALNGVGVASGGFKTASAAKNLTTAARTMQLVKASAEASVTSQLIEMKLGTRKEFDFKQVLSAAGAQYAGSKINIPHTDAIPDGLTNKVANTLSSAAINSALYWQRPDLASLAAQSIGSSIGESAGGAFNQSLESHAEINAAKNTQRNTAQVTHEQAKLLEASEAVSKVKLPDGKIDVSNPNWSKKLSDIARKQRQANQRTASVSPLVKKVMHAGPVIASKHPTQGGVMDYVDAFNNGVETSVGMFTEAMRHPFNTVAQIGVTAWDGINAVGEATVGITSEGSRLRNIQRGKAGYDAIENFKNGDSVYRTKVISEVLSGAVMGSAVGEVVALDRLSIFSKALSQNLNVASEASVARLKSQLGFINFSKGILTALPGETIVEGVADYTQSVAKQGLFHLGEQVRLAGQWVKESLMPELPLQKHGKIIGAETLATIQRVLGNISESKTARNVTNFAVYSAKENQVIAGYNADAWTMTMLKKGDIVYGGLPGQSAFYTTEKTLLDAGYTKEILYNLLQVKADPILGLRPSVGAYKVMQDLRVPSGIIKANPHLGIGGGQQYFINNFESALKLNKTLELGEYYEYLSSYKPGR